MANTLEVRALSCLEDAGDAGLTMGNLVDTLVGEGFEEGTIETELWELMQRREVTPHGYVRRQLRPAPGSAAGAAPRRIYEFVLRRWSPELDAQLEIPGT